MNYSEDLIYNITIPAILYELQMNIFYIKEQIQTLKTIMKHVKYKKTLYLFRYIFNLLNTT